MAKQAGYNLMGVIAWITGILVSLAVGFGMINGVLAIGTSQVLMTITQIAGWIVVIGAIISVIMAIFNK